MTHAVSRPTAFWLVSFAFFVTMFGATLPTPLYPIYAAAYGISPVFITVVFAAYAVGVITSLLLTGKLSDQVGRRPVLIPGLVLAFTSSLVFLLANNTELLYLGRVLSGFSAGVFTGTATATLVDLAPGGRRGFATAVAVAVNLGGLAVGSLISGLLAEWVPEPLRLPYALHAALLVPAIVGVALCPETAAAGGQARRFRIQRLGVPPEVRGLFGRAAIVGFCAFAVSGLFGAVAPTLLVRLLSVSSHAVAGLLAFLLMAFSAAGQLTTSRLPQRRAFAIGCSLLTVGVALLATSLLSRSLPWLVASAVVVGMGQGLAIGSGLAAINTRVSGERRGEAASTYFVVLYVGLMLPVVGYGLAANAIGIRSAGLFFAGIVGVAVLAVLASLIWLARDNEAPPVTS